MTDISILRGINVGGHNAIKMNALCQLFVDMGFDEVQTYIQSGNVIFRDESYEIEVLEKKIKEKIADTFHFEVPVIVKKLSELKEIILNNPFVNIRHEDVTKLHVTFLSMEPLIERVDKIQSHQFAPDEFIISNKTIYLFCPNGYGTAKLTNNFFENKLNVTATTRNWRTINELVNMADKGKGHL